MVFFFGYLGNTSKTLSLKPTNFHSTVPIASTNRPFGGVFCFLTRALTFDTVYIHFKTVYMSQTQITFLSDKKLKERTIKKAKSEGITLKALLTMAMRAYTEGKLQVGLTPHGEHCDKLFADKDIVKKSNQLGSLLETA